MTEQETRLMLLRFQLSNCCEYLELVYVLCFVGYETSPDFPSARGGEKMMSGFYISVWPLNSLKFSVWIYNSALFMEDLLRTWIRFSVPCCVVSASQETKRSCRLNEATAGRRRTVVWVNSWFSCSQTSRLWIITTSLNVKTYCTVWLFKGKKKSVTEELISWIRNGFTLVTTGCIWGGVHSLDLLYVKVSGNRLFSDTF